jgi:hypothetical protein
MYLLIDLAIVYLVFHKMWTHGNQVFDVIVIIGLLMLKWHYHHDT